MGDDGPMERSSGGDGWAVPGSSAEPVVAPEGPATSPPEGPPGPPSPPPPKGPPVPTGTVEPGPSTSPAEPLDGTLATAGPLEAPTAEVPRLDLRPMTVADILDGAFTIIKARPARIFGIAALFVVPINLLMAYLQRNLLDVGLWELYTSDPAVIADQSEQAAANQNLALVMGLVLPGLALVAVAATIARLVRGWSLGVDTPAGELLRAAGRSWWALLASFVVVHLAEFASMGACGIGIVFVMPLFAMTAPVIGAEGAGPMAAISRSCSLAGRRYWPVVGLSWLIGVVSWLLTNALGGLPQALVAYAGTDVAWPALAAGNILGSMVTTPFVAAATVLLYLDLRVRTEGLDLELAVGDLDDHVAA